jgi:hypothetical protein
LIEEVDVPAERFEIAYTYREVPGIPPVKSEVKRFLSQRLISANRKYTREDINTISSRVNRDVWKYRGGWYSFPQDDPRYLRNRTPWCRHEWVQQLVIRQR